MMRRLIRGTSLAAIGAVLLSFAPHIATAEEAVKEHPLDPALRWARSSLKDMEGIKGYSATLIKRERIGKTLLPKEYIYLKVRHEPFSVYMYFIGPAEMKGRECIYVQGQNNNKLIAHGTSALEKLVGTVRLDPNGIVAMRNQRYPITTIGVLNLTRELIRRAEEDKLIDSPTEVKFFKSEKLKINGRSVTCIQVTHPEKHPKHTFHKVRLFVDNQLNIPIRYESYDFPGANGKPVLTEEYTYLKLDTTKAFTPKDFDPENPNYDF
jgi:hypothetical protein